jgi:hypothetical protein
MGVKRCWFEGVKEVVVVVETRGVEHEEPRRRICRKIGRRRSKCQQRNRRCNAC